MKLLRTAVIALAIGVASISTASARDSFSLDVNIGGYGYAPPVAYYPAPPVVYLQPAYILPRCTTCVLSACSFIPVLQCWIPRL